MRLLGPRCTTLEIDSEPSSCLLRPGTTGSCRRAFERPRRTCWRSSRRSALELRPSIRVGLFRALGARVAPEAIVVLVCVPLLGLPPVHVVVMRAFEQFGGGGSRTCACCELQPCGIRARGPCGLGSRSTHARELACVHEIACHVVPPRVWSAYFLNGLVRGISRVQCRVR